MPFGLFGGFGISFHLISFWLIPDFFAIFPIFGCSVVETEWPSAGELPLHYALYW